MKNNALTYRALSVKLSLCLLALASCTSKNNQAGGNAAGGAPPVQSYPAFKVEAQTATLYQEYPATLQGQQNIEIRPKIDGYIQQIFVDEGAAVKRGQPLFRLSAPQYQQEVNTAAAAINSAQADVNTAQLQVQKAKPLVDKGIISSYELQSAQNTLETRRAALAQAKATLANARTNVGYTLITSPVNGVVGTIPYKLGSLITSSTAQPLTTVSNIGKVYAYFSLNEKQLLDFSRQYKGSTLAAKLSQLPPVSLILADGTDYPEKGHVETISGLINTNTGSASFRAGFPNPLGLIRSGGSASVRIPQAVKGALLVPQKSTYELQGKRFVYKLDAGGKVTSAEIQTLSTATGEFFVVTQGINAGDTLVLESALPLQDGTTIKPDLQPASVVYKSVQ